MGNLKIYDCAFIFIFYFLPCFISLAVKTLSCLQKWPTFASVHLLGWGTLCMIVWRGQPCVWCTAKWVNTESPNIQRQNSGWQVPWLASISIVLSLGFKNALYKSRENFLPRLLVIFKNIEAALSWIGFIKLIWLANWQWL